MSLRIILLLLIILPSINLFGTETKVCESLILNFSQVGLAKSIQFTSKSWDHIEGEFSGNKIKSGLHTFQGIQKLSNLNPESKVVSLNAKSYQEFKDAIKNILNEKNHKNTIYIYEFEESSAIAAFIPQQMMNSKAKSATYISAVSGRGHYLTKSLWPKKFTKIDIENSVRNALREGFSTSLRRDQILIKAKNGITIEVKKDTFEVITAYREIDQIWLGEILMKSGLNLEHDLYEIFLDIKNSKFENIDEVDWLLSEAYGDAFIDITHNYNEVLLAIVSFSLNQHDHESYIIVKKAFTNYIMKQDLDARDLLLLIKYKFEDGGIAVWDIFEEEVQIYPKDQT
ncbi:MAG: hypothetical protein H6622_15895 [Halobacteriovoraceae bacterium]|nr:hypothetical protein [Halobacteriovoraceae bacterium]